MDVGQRLEISQGRTWILAEYAGGLRRRFADALAARRTVRSGRYRQSFAAYLRRSERFVKGIFRRGITRGRTLRRRFLAVAAAKVASRRVFEKSVTHIQEITQQKRRSSRLFVCDLSCFLSGRLLIPLGGYPPLYRFYLYPTRLLRQTIEERGTAV